MPDPLQAVFQHAVRTHGRDKVKVRDHLNHWLSTLRAEDRQRIGNLHYHVDIEGNVLAVESIVTAGGTEK